jgi:hypothetical protein
MPIFKCINNNCLKIVGSKLSFGHAKALAQMIKENTDAERHVLQCHLDDCSMQD